MSLGLASPKSPWSLAVTVTRTGPRRWGSAHPPGRRVSGPGVARKSPWSLAFIVRENRQFLEGAGVVPTPPGRRVSGPGVARKSPWSLAVTVTENRTKGRWGSAHPTRETCLWAWRRSKKPLELSCDRYREPDQGALGQCPPRQGDVSLGLASLEKAPGAPLFKRSKPKSTKSHVQSFPDGTSNQLPLTDPPPGSRSNPEPTQGRGAVPGLPRRLRHPGCLAQAPVFDLVVFEPKFIQGPLPHGRAERAALVGKAGRGPEATVPAAGDPKTLSRWHLKTASLTDRPPARGRDRSRSRERRALLGKATDEEGVGSSTLARNETPRPSDSKLGTQVDPDGPYPTPPPPSGTNSAKLGVVVDLQGPYPTPPSRVDTPPGAGDRHPCFRHPHPPLTPSYPTQASHRPPLLRGTSENHPTCSPAEPGTPTLKPGLLTQPTAPSGEPGHWSPWERFTAGHPGKSLPLVTPGEIYRWSPRIDLGNQDLGQRGATLLHPLYPPQGTRTSGRGGRLSYTHSTRLREPGPRAEGATLLHPLYPPQGTRTSGRGGHSPAPPLPASGNQDLGQRGGTVRTPFYSPRTLSSPAASPPRAPPDLQEGPLPRPPFEPGHPTLKPGLLTRPSAPSGEPGHWAPRGRFYHWSPRIDLGFGRLSLGLPGFPGDSASPTHGTTTPARGGAPRTPPPPASGNQTLARRGPLSRTPSATGSPRIDLGFFSGRPSAPATGTPGTPQGVEPRPPGWASSSADKRLDRGKTFNGSQRVSCSATHETLTQNQVVYESFSTGFSTNFRCVSREGRRCSPPPGPVTNGSPHRPAPEGRPAIPGQSEPRGAAVSSRLGGILT
ncbi:hypothetical protein G5714_024654 [Onychostoma macrolepis]|uniref:Uncharacterized protein n=1 Tax=Onychostoma macrolepis TaxID=369639 RepID=A0A7J6BK80_9TELE|nr:hypothetical protein G5714_024654 [Onychostoma macrolepis]